MKVASHLYAILLLLVPLSAAQSAELKLATIFSDHMVLQRDKPVPVWGWADPGERIRVAFAGQTQMTTADADGRWQVQLKAMPANAKPQSLSIQSDKPNRRREVTDILVGEVWLGSGQSNMAMTVSRARDFEQEKAAADAPLIRMFKENSGAAKTPQTDAQGSWSVCSPETVGNFSATLYFFGRTLHEELNVPVGLINSSVGGTPIESWIAAEAQARSPELQEAHAADLKAYQEFDEAKATAQYENALARWKERAAKAKAAGQPVPRRPVSLVERHKRRGGPGGLFNGKIFPLIPYAIRGVVWYQGEANSQPGKGHLYQYQLPLLVKDWRKRWGEELPFAWVQLPNFQREGEGWMLVREGMLKTLRLPHTGMAITTDIGESNDIHPKNKQDVGRRLGVWALGDVYEKKGIATSGPLPAAHKIQGKEIVVSFTHCDGGLKAEGDQLTGFEIAGEDGRWKPATARIEGDHVVVSHPSVSNPTAVRYAWAADPEANLFNGQGLPASPFRTVVKTH